MNDFYAFSVKLWEEHKKAVGQEIHLRPQKEWFKEKGKKVLKPPKWRKSRKKKKIYDKKQQSLF